MKKTAARLMRSINRRRRAVLVVVGLIVVAAASSLTTLYITDKDSQNQVAQRQTVNNDGNLKSTSTENAISQVVDAVSPSVVSIVTNMSTQTMFGVAQQQAAGTGIILSKDGYIITNGHVIASASQVQVITSDGTVYDSVQVVGTDPLNDIAYLKVNGVDNLKPATIGDSSTVRVGQQVVAIGNALGQYQNTVSSGIISGMGRPIQAGDASGSSTESLTDLLQTDAAINPGNSGGPLLNYSGQVVGIDTAVASNAEGIGFAIPINATKGTTKMVLAGKGVQHAFMGLGYVEITPAVAKQFNLSVKQGAYVTTSGSNSAAIVAGSPAEKAGLQDKDVITQINGEQVGVAGSVATLVGEYAPGDTINVTYLRGGSSHTVKVTLDAYHSQD
ncbi:MAG: trypsin-like peptidase domain-containing protein [Candidatus Saccharimonas sp.]